MMLCSVPSPPDFPYTVYPSGPAFRHNWRLYKVCAFPQYRP